MTPSCFSRQGGSIHMLFILERSILKFDLRSRQVKITVWPKQVMLHISRCALTRQTLWHQSHVSSSVLSKFIGKKCTATRWRHNVTSDDLSKGKYLCPYCTLRVSKSLDFLCVFDMLSNFEKCNLRSGHLMWPGAWKRDLWVHRVIVFFLMCQIVGRTAMANLAALRVAVFFFRYLRKTWSGRRITAPPPPPGRARVSCAPCSVRGSVEIDGTWCHSYIICGRPIISWSFRFFIMCKIDAGEGAESWYLHSFRGCRKKTREGLQGTESFCRVL